MSMAIRAGAPRLASVGKMTVMLMHGARLVRRLNEDRKPIS
jgi:hypothetical protein